MSFPAIALKVPATTANLGPGFDVLGLALQFYNIFEILPGDTTKLSIEIKGDQGKLPTDQTNLFYRVIQKFYEEQGAKIPHLKLRIQVNIPPTRGFGSSSTAVVAGIVGANRLLGEPLNKKQMLTKAMEYEVGQHPDNVSAALLGGLVVNTVTRRGRLISQKLPFPSELQAVVYIPDREMSTEEGRNLLPDEYSKADTIFTASRIALLLSALQRQDFKELKVAMNDVIHQPYRRKIYPEMPELIKAATKAGAYGAALSGAGPTILAFASEKQEQIALALQDKADELALPGHTMILPIDHDGTKIRQL